MKKLILGNDFSNSLIIQKAVFEYLILLRMDFQQFSFTVFFIVIVLIIEKIYQIKKTVFEHISEHNLAKLFKSTLLCIVSIFNPVIIVWKSSQTWSFAFDILHKKIKTQTNEHCKINVVWITLQLKGSQHSFFWPFRHLDLLIITCMYTF